MGCCVQMEDVEIEDVDLCVWVGQMGRVWVVLLCFLLLQHTDIFEEDYCSTENNVQLIFLCKIIFDDKDFFSPVATHGPFCYTRYCRYCYFII